MSKKYPQVVLDVSIGGEPAGRITFELFTDITPKTAENFRGLCTGEYGNSQLTTNKKKLHYKGSKFHRIIDGFVIQGGDFMNGDGTGSASIYNGHFADENFTRRHACAGLLSMANCGRNSNGSQFFVTLKSCPHLDGKHVVFGQVVDGMHVIRKIARTPVDARDTPKIPVMITNCDEVGDSRNHIRNDPFSKEHQLIVQKSDLVQKQKDQDDLELQEKQKIELKLKQIDDQIKAIDDKKVQDAEDLKTFQKVSQNLKETTKDRLKQLQEKINEAKNKNTKAVLEEERQNQDPNYEKNKKMKKYYEKKQEKQKILESRGLDKTQAYLNQTAAQAEHYKGKNKEKGSGFGWDVFNADSLYKAYNKRCGNLKLNEEHYEQQKKNPEQVGEMQEGLNRLSEDIQKQMAKREKFSNRRKINPDEKVDFINDRNRVYNDKLDRAFSPYVEDIRANLEKKQAD